MIVDDSDIVLEVIGSALREEGYRVITRNRPTGCVALMLQEEPDLVLVDVTMPGVGGDTLVRCFGTAHPTSRSVVLLHSSLPEDALSAKAKASGAHGYIRKTDNMSSFVRDVGRWIRRVNAERPEENQTNTSMMRPKAPTVSAAPQPETRRVTAFSGAHVLGAVPTVLLVDSDMLVLSEYRRLLSQADVSVELALSSEHALRVMSSTPTVVVVCNVLTRMPNGATLFEHATRMDPAWQNQFVLIADHARVAREVPTFEADFPDRMLRRPLQAPALTRAVRSCFSGLGLLYEAG